MITTCCMCIKHIDKNESLIPSICLSKHGINAHRICQDCWWHPNTGFAREYGIHSCPGCRNNFPLNNGITNNNTNKNTNAKIIINLLDD